MPTIDDQEFGLISIRKSSQSRTMKASVAPGGSLRISVPMYVPLFVVKRMIASSRSDLRKLLDTRPKIIVSDGMTIGKSHSLHVRSGTQHHLKRSGNQLLLTLAPDEHLEDKAIVEEVRSTMQAILRREAKAHLPKRLQHIASLHSFSYSTLRFSHASTRWGSCNSKQAISLNIGLMNLPFELIDYVLIHELSHTKHLNHSLEFWNEVAKVDPNYKQHRKQLKSYDPGV